MLSADQWWGIIESYGAAVWPAQAIFFIVATALVPFLIFKPGKIATALTTLYLVLSFGWIGMVFFMILGKDLAGSYFSGSLFVLVAILFAVDLFRGRIQFRHPEPQWQKYLTLALVLIVFCYPLISLVLGHYFPRVLILGTFPCPTTALALLLLTTALPRVDKIMYIILLFWAIPFPPFIQIPKYGVYEDTIMFIVGIYSLIMLVWHWKNNGVGSRFQKVR
jgi:branched-subunit amino acid transport protein AzlD